ncbi:MAG: polysaccharide biosynthesis tyrosine autokinase [Sulfitobacter sp.]
MFKSRRSGSVALRAAQRVSLRQHDAAPVPDDTIDLGRLGRAIWLRKWLVLATTLVFACAFLFSSLTQDPIYTANSTVMLDPREQQVISSQEQVVSDLKLSNPILESEVALLRSSTLVKTVVLEIGLDRFNALDPALAKPSLTRRITRTIRSGIDALVGSRDAETPENAPLVSAEVARENRIVSAVRDGLVVRRVGDSYVIEINVSTIDPVLSAEIANVLAENYIEEQLADRQRVAQDATRWLATQVDSRRLELANAEAEVEAYQRDQLVETGASEEMLQQQLVELNQQISLDRSNRATETARLSRIERVLAERGVAAATEGLESPYLSSLREQRAELAREDARLAASLGKSHPDRSVLLSEIAQLDGAMEDEVQAIAEGHRNEIEILLARERSLQSDMDAIESQLASISTASLRLRELEREAEARRGGFEELLGRLGETRAQVEIQRSEAKMVNVAQVPLGPSGPRIKLMTAFGAMLGLTAGLVAALMLELLGSGFTQSSELERLTQIPVLASIPRAPVGRISDLLDLIKGPNFSALSERIRQLRMMLLLNAQPGQPLSVVLLSSVQDEGKSTTALALAASFATAGHKTILVDLDTRRSVMLSQFSKQANSDLGDWVEGKAHLDETIVEIDELDLSVCGTQRSTALLADTMDTDKLHELIGLLGQKFDVIIADAPPVLAVSDGLSIASAVDHILYMVRYRTTSRRSLTYGLSILRHVGLAPTGLVLTIADIEADPDGYAQGYTNL